MRTANFLFYIERIESLIICIMYSFPKKIVTHKLVYNLYVCSLQKIALVFGSNSKMTPRKYIEPLPPEYTMQLRGHKMLGANRSHWNRALEGNTDFM